MRIKALLFLLVGVAGCSADPTGSSGEAWTSGTPACGSVIASWNGINAYSNGKCFGNVACTNCDGQGFSVHTSSNGQTAYGGAWQCVELVTRAFDTKFGVWLSNNAGSPLCKSANGTAGLTVYGPGYHDTSPPEPVAGDALVWNYNGGIGHTALVTGNSSSSVSYMEQNWGSTTGYAGTGTTPWNGSNFGAPSDSLGGFTPACWIHANANTTGTCVYGNGLYCGGDGVTGDARTLYTCSNGSLTVDQVCGVSCVHNPPHVNDACAPCPNGDGSYCGGHGVGSDPSTLYMCKSGQVTPLEACEHGCEHGSTGDQCTSFTPMSSPNRVDVPAPAATTPTSPETPASSGGCNTAGASGDPSLLLLGLALALQRKRACVPTQPLPTTRRANER
jgi:hypothetical protein